MSTEKVMFNGPSMH